MLYAGPNEKFEDLEKQMKRQPKAAMVANALLSFQFPKLPETPVSPEQALKNELSKRRLKLEVSDNESEESSEDNNDNENDSFHPSYR